MKNSEDRSGGGIRITDNQVQIDLAPDEAYALWQWLSARKYAFQSYAREKQLELEIHLYQPGRHRARTQDAPFPTVPVSSIDVYQCESFVKLAPCSVMML